MSASPFKEFELTSESEMPAPPVRHRMSVSWDALEDAFENNAPEVRSYLHLETGEVLRLVDGAVDPSVLGRIMSDTLYLRVDPVSSREQYRWMERFIAVVDDAQLQLKLTRAIDGKGAFRRFKDALADCPADRERWFSFRSERVRSFIEAWLVAQGIEALPRVELPPPLVPVRADAASSPEEEAAAAGAHLAVLAHDRLSRRRRRLLELANRLLAADLETVVVLAEFLDDRARPSIASASPAADQGVDTSNGRMAASGRSSMDADELDPDEDW